MSRTEYAAGTAARRQIDQLDPPTGEEGIATDKNGVGPIGLEVFLARADELADRYGERFRPTAYLRDLAAKGERLPA